MVIRMRLCAIVLAAGLSSRMGEDKLIMDYDGAPLGEYILKNLLYNQKDFSQIIVVGRLPQTEEAAGRYGFTYVKNTQPQLGMGYSLALGVLAAENCDGFFVALSDMPLLKHGTVHTLCTAFSKEPQSIAVPICGGKRGNPVIFPSRFRTELSTLSGDYGGREIIKREHEKLLRVQVYDVGILRDIDTKKDITE
ncbi:MAG: nucleotidyltransferase family protein [Hydrogenoanaerobacterium sp.]